METTFDYDYSSGGESEGGGIERQVREGRTVFRVDRLMNYNPVDIFSYFDPILIFRTNDSLLDFGKSLDSFIFQTVLRSNLDDPSEREGEERRAKGRDSKIHVRRHHRDE